MLLVPNAACPKHGFYALGLTCFGLGGAHYLLEGEGLGTLLELFMIWGLSAIVLHTGYRSAERHVSPSGRWRALLLGVGVTAAFTLLAFAVWLTWFLEGKHMELTFLLSFAAALGAAVGTRSSLYAVESDERLTESQQLTKLLKINQRVLRHNLRNELSVVLGHLENIEAADSTDDIGDDVRIIRDHLEMLLETSERARRIVTIWDTDTKREFDLASLVADQASRLRARHPDVDLTTTLPEECRVTAHSALPLAVEEALTNAVEHNPADVSVTATVRARGGDTAVLEIADTGGGIPTFDRDAIAQPEETALSHAQGLGLWIIYWTVEASDGTLDIDENDPEGTVIRITLPTPESRSRPF